MNFIDTINSQLLQGEGPGSASGVFGIENQADLGNGSYGDPKVAFDDEYRDILNWMLENDGAPKVSEYRFFTPFSLGPRSAPTMVLFTDGETGVALDAVQIKRSPSSNLTALRLAFGVMLPVIDYPGFAARQTQTSANPVGDPWPDHGNMIYHVSPSFNAADWPEGSIYPGASGRFERIRVVAPAQGSPFSQATPPAWRKLS